MPRRDTKRKRENPLGKYPGKLGRRRKPSEKLSQMFDWHAAGVGIDPTIYIDGEDLQSWIDQSGCVAEGIGTCQWG
jgi:hypothetical protein